MALAAETQPMARSPCSITQAMLAATDHSTMLSALLRSTITSVDSVTTPLAIPRSSIIKLPLRIPRLVISRSRVMTRVEVALPITTRQLALRHSQITLRVVRTQPWVQGQDQTSTLASITLTSATLLVPTPTTKAIPSASATSRTGTGPGP